MSSLPLAKQNKIFTAPTFFHEWNETDHVKDGYDWSMPNWVEPAENSAILSPRQIGNFDYKRKDEILLENGFRGQFKKKVAWNWKKLEPSEGQYDFQSLRDEMIRVSENGTYKLKLTIYVAVYEFDFLNADGSVDTSLNNYQKGVIDIEESAPKWLVDSYDIPRQSPSFEEANVRMINLDEFDQKYHFRYKKLIAALGESGILNDPPILNAYVCLGSPMRGEEGEGPKPEEANYYKYLERLDTWANAAGSDVAKLTNVASNEINVQTGIERGMGQRSGYAEQYLMRLTNPQIGTKVSPEGYVEYDENTIIYKEGRVSGDENEHYFLEASHIERFGDPSSYKHRYRESTLRLLQMRRTTIWDEWAEGFVNPPLSQFASLSLAKTVNTTADAWCYLRQSNMIRNNPNNAGLVAAVAPEFVNPDGTIPVKNFERWLYQRDGGDIKTVPTLAKGQGGTIIFRSPNYPFDYTARKTDRNNGFSKIGFALDDRFALGSDTQVAIKVSYLDSGDSSWHLSYKNRAGQQIKKVVTNENSNTIKTVTWIIRDIALDASEMDNDFFLIADQGDLTASFVRIVKLEPSSNSGGLGLNDGTWHLENKATQKRIGVKNCDTDILETVPLVLTANNDSNACSTFEFIPSDGDYFFIQNQVTKGRFRSKNCSTTANDTVEIVQVGEGSYGWCEQWRLVDVGDGYYRIENRQTGQWIRSKDCNGSAGSSITQVSTAYTGNCTLWKLTDAKPAATALKKTIEESSLVYLYPVPVENRLFLASSGLSDNIIDLDLFTIDGKLVYHIASNELATIKNEGIDVVGLDAGLYIMSINLENGEKQSLQFIIEQ